MIIRTMQPADVTAVAALEEKIFSVPWTQKSFADALCRADTIYLIAEKKDAVIGYCGLWLSPETADLCNLAVDKACRRQHVASRLLCEAFTLAKEAKVTSVFLEVRAGNTAARALYEKLGFARMGVRKGYYRKPEEDAVVMEKKLTKSLP